MLKFSITIITYIFFLVQGEDFYWNNDLLKDLDKTRRRKKIV